VKQSALPPARLNDAPPILGFDTDATLSEFSCGADDIRAMKQLGNVGVTAVYRRNSRADWNIEE